jgi:iron complex outermembrane receptor protein
LLGASLAALVPAGTAMAQLEEIVVTARRQEERLQTVPIAITAFSQQDLEDKRVFALRDVVAYTPSLNINQNSSDAFSPYSANVVLRGLPGAVTYFSQVPTGAAGQGGLAGMTAIPGHYMDLNHVEIAKGPQGTLFGTNAIGGAILLEPARPTNNFEGSIQLGYGNYSNKEATAVVNVPVVSDKLLVRVAGQATKRDGYTRLLNSSKRLDDRNYQSWRFGVTFRPTDEIENYLVYDGFHQNQNGSSSILNALAGPGDSTNFINSFFPTLRSVLAQQQALGPRTQVSRNVPLGSRAKTFGVTDIFTWNLTDTLTLKNIAAVRVVRATAPVDMDGTSFSILEPGPVTPAQVALGWFYNSRQYTDELQFQGKAFGDRLSWTVGGFLLYTEPGGPTFTESTSLGSTTYNQTHNVSRSQAVYAQGVYDLSDLVEGLKFTGGFRYNWDYVSNEQRSFTASGACASSIFANASCLQGNSGKFKAPGWTVGLDYQVAPDTLVYVRSGHAYLAGFTNLTAPSAEFAKVRPQKITDVEVGVKTDLTLGDVKARFNADVFRSWFDDIAVPKLVTFVNAAGLTVVNNATVNAAAASVKGAELEATVIPVDALEFQGHVSYVKTHYTDYPVATFGRAAPEIMYVPRWQYGISGTYHLPVPETLGEMSFTASWNWFDKQYVSANPTFNQLPGYGKLDLRLNWNNLWGKPVDLAFYMTNATDRTYAAGRYPLMAQLGFDSLTYAEPRMYGFQLKYRFGAGL